MGLLFSKSKIINIESNSGNKLSTREIIQRYEYIKQTIEISNIDMILELIEDIDWDNVYIPTPSSPPLPIAHPI
jgi:hypothetical protein